MKLYLIRHGQSVANRDHLSAGWGEYPLTELGREQARRVGEYLRRMKPFDKIYVSDLVRTRQTFECAFGPETEHVLCPLIREVHAPFAGRSFAELVEEYGPDYQAAMRRMDYSAFGGEGPQELAARLLAFRDQVVADNLERVAAVCHAGVIRAFLALTVGVPSTELRPFTDNCAISVFEYDRNENTWRLRHYNWIPELE